MIDSKLLFSDDQAMTTTAVSTNVVDLGAAETALGEEENLRLVCNVTAALATGTSLKIELKQCATEGGSYTVLASSDVYLTAELTAGTKIFDIGLPCTHQRYLALNYVIVGTFDAGTITSYITAR